MGKSEDRTARRFLRRIEQLSRDTSRRKFLESGLQGFLDKQLMIAQLQREVQREISTLKVRSRSDRSLLKDLERLRRTRWHARRLGDGVAWTALIYDKRTIYALARNGRVPIASEEDDGSRGVALTASNLVQNGWGLPILHDITDCLRIGDITLLSFGETKQDKVYRTLEIKTSRIDESTNADGESVVQLQVTAIGTEPLPDLTLAEVPSLKAVPSESNLLLPKRRDDRRLKKQFDRMVEAVTHRTAPSYQMHEVGGTHHLALETEVEERSHWPALRRAIRQARRDGYAFFSIDGFVGYGLWYNTAGVTEEDIKTSTFADDLKGSILSTEPAPRDSISIRSVPVDEDDPMAPFTMPFTVYEIPQRAIGDILHERLTIISATNTGRVERALKKVGFTVEPEPESSDAREFKLRVDLAWPTGEHLQLEVPAPWIEISVAVMEFLGLETIVSKVAAITAIPSKMSFEDFTRGRPGAPES